MCQDQEKAFSDLVEAKEAHVREKQLEKLPGTLVRQGLSRAPEILKSCLEQELLGYILGAGIGMNLGSLIKEDFRNGGSKKPVREPEGLYNWKQRP